MDLTQLPRLSTNREMPRTCKALACAKASFMQPVWAERGRRSGRCASVQTRLSPGRSSVMQYQAQPNSELCTKSLPQHSIFPRPQMLSLPACYHNLFQRQKKTKKKEVMVAGVHIVTEIKLESRSLCPKSHFMKTLRRGGQQ